MDGKTAFVFPGQGAQKVGMGQNLAKRFTVADSLVKRAGELLGFDLALLCYEGPDEELSKTENTQPAILTVSCMALEVFRRECAVKPDFVAGHSLGEFSALYAAGTFTFDDAVTIVRKRGTYMSCAPEGGMAAVLGLGADVIESICWKASDCNSHVKPANYNGDGQTVIAGNRNALEKAIVLLKKEGAKRILPLNVSSAFHTPLMKEAEKKLSADLDGMKLKSPATTLVNNVDAEFVTDAQGALDGLKRQVTGAVRWTGVMRKIMESGVKTVVEFGPGRTLCGIIRRMDKTIKLLNVEDEDSLNKTLEALNE